MHKLTQFLGARNPQIPGPLPPDATVASLRKFLNVPQLLTTSNTVSFNDIGIVKACASRGAQQFMARSH